MNPLSSFGKSVTHFAFFLTLFLLPSSSLLAQSGPITLNTLDDEGNCITDLSLFDLGDVFQLAFDSDDDGYSRFTDCDDQNEDVHPDAAELCNGYDDNCNCTTDEDLPTDLLYYEDLDGDGFGAGNLKTTGDDCIVPYYGTDDNTDCDDENENIYPSNAEVCDDLDNDCNQSVDDNLSSLFYDLYPDSDQDGYGDESEEVIVSCSITNFGLGNYVQDNNTDCDDDDPNANPGKPEIFCNAKDDDCSGVANCAAEPDGDDTDFDGDGFSPPADCEDYNNTKYPGATEIPCDGQDQDCSGGADFCPDTDQDGSPDHLDCDDNNPNISPLVAEITCDNIDQNCNGLDLCIADADQDGSPDAVDCNDTNPNISPLVVELNNCDNIDQDCNGTDLCETDVDNDGSYAEDDCDDNNPFIKPEGLEYCNEIDDDCDDEVDEYVNASLGFYIDEDTDGYGAYNPEETVTHCNYYKLGYVLNYLDCDDNNRNIGNCNNSAGADEDADNDGATDVIDCNDANDDVHQGATEYCNEIDDDCSGTVDDNLASILFYGDEDADGYGTAFFYIPHCNLTLAGHVRNNFDCDDSDANVGDCLEQGSGDADGDGSLDAADCNDTNPAINPSATELCNGVDDNCNNDIDEGVVKPNYYTDGDGDGFGAGTATPSCTAISGKVTNALDCNDSNPSIGDCNSVIDADGDGSPTGVDCNDNNAAIKPGATEICNNVDDDCDSQTDEGLTMTNYYLDTDGDSYGAGAATSSCQPIAGSVTNATDCNNNNAAIKPGATEVCNNIDDDCANGADNGLTFTNYYIDTDSDGYGAGAATSSCQPIAGSVTNATDCNNNNAAIKPGATEVCNNIDDDCANGADNGLTFTNYYIDTDSDGYGAGAATSSCQPIAGSVTNATDCNNNNAAIKPGATEVCNNIDDDCANGADNGLTFTNYYIDTDSDGYGAGAATSSCQPIAGSVANATDCDNNNAAIKPGATEVCNNIDDDCAGGVDNGLSFTNYYLDTDNDTYGAGAATSSCQSIAGSVTNATDCDNNNPAIKPGATEICNGLNIDENCDGITENTMACVAPSILPTATVSGTSATMSWSLGCFSRYRLQYKKKGTSSWVLKYPAIGAPANSITATGLSVGVYQWTLKAQCYSSTIWSPTATGNQFVIGAGLYAADQPTATSVNITPNPAQDWMLIDLAHADQSHCLVRLIDAMGKTVYVEQLIVNDQAQLLVPVQDLTTGVYFLQVSFNGERTIGRTVMIAR
jgi:large repetitive protein